MAQQRWAFWGGSVMVVIGVALHLPMFWMGRMTGFRLVGMAVSPGMLVGMALIVLGVLAAAYGLLPSGVEQRASIGSVVPPEDAPLTRAHWVQIGLLGLALVVDVMKSSHPWLRNAGHARRVSARGVSNCALAAQRAYGNYRWIPPLGTAR